MKVFKLLRDSLLPILLVLILVLVVAAFFVDDAGAMTYQYRLTADVPFTTNHVRADENRVVSGTLDAGMKFKILGEKNGYTKIKLVTEWIVYVPTDQLQYELIKPK